MLIQRCRQEIMSTREFSLTIRKAQLNGAKKISPREKGEVLFEW